MKKIAYALVALIFLSGCALTTIRSYKAKRPQPEKGTVVEKVKKVFTPRPVEVEEKEEIK